MAETRRARTLFKLFFARLGGCGGGADEAIARLVSFVMSYPAEGMTMGAYKVRKHSISPPLEWDFSLGGRLCRVSGSNWVAIL